MVFLPKTGANREIFLKFSQGKSGRKNDLSFFSIILSVFTTLFTVFSSGGAIDSLDGHLLYVFNILLSPYSLIPHCTFLPPWNSLHLQMELQSAHYTFSPHIHYLLQCVVTPTGDSPPWTESFPEATVLHKLHLIGPFHEVHSFRNNSFPWWNQRLWQQTCFSEGFPQSHRLFVWDYLTR